DAVQDDGELIVLAGGQRVCVLLADPSMRRPAGVAEPGRRLRPVRAGCLLQVLQVADGTHVFEAVLLEQRQARRVVAAVLEPLQSVNEEVLTGPAAHVSDDPAHPRPPSPKTPRFPCNSCPETRTSPATAPPPASEVGQPSSRVTRV